MKKGISLIVLVITIIIIIILAGAVILNLADNNPIENASEAALLSEQTDVNSGLTVYLGSIAAEEGAAYRIRLNQAQQKDESGNLLYVDPTDSTSTTTEATHDEDGETVANKPFMGNDPDTVKPYVGKDVEGETIEGYYELGSFTVTCGDDANIGPAFASTSTLTKAISFNGSKYLGKTHRLVMNLGGNLKLVEGKAAPTV